MSVTSHLELRVDISYTVDVCDHQFDLWRMFCYYNEDLLKVVIPVDGPIFAEWEKELDVLESAGFHSL